MDAVSPYLVFSSLSLFSLDIIVNRVLAAAAGFVPASQYARRDSVQRGSFCKFDR